MVGFDSRGSTALVLYAFRGRKLTAEELQKIREQIETQFDVIEEVDPEIRSIVKRNWPHLLAKLPPE